MDITVTVNPDLYAVRCVATGATGTVHWFRRQGGTDTPIGDGAEVWDYTVDLNTPVEYRATDDVETLTSPVVEVTATYPVLGSTTSQLAFAVTVVDYRPIRSEGRTVVHPILGRGDPFVTIAPMLYPSGELRLYAARHADRSNLWQLLRGGEPLLLRTTCPERVDTVQFAVLSAEDPFTNDTAKHGPAYFTIEWQAITETTGITPPVPRTYTDVLNNFATYQAVVDFHPDYRSLLDGPDS